jgi:hypothetical protein
LYGFYKRYLPFFIYPGALKLTSHELIFSGYRPLRFDQAPS